MNPDDYFEAKERAVIETSPTLKRHYGLTTTVVKTSEGGFEAYVRFKGLLLRKVATREGWAFSRLSESVREETSSLLTYFDSGVIRPSLLKDICRLLGEEWTDYLLDPEDSKDKVPQTVSQGSKK